MCAPQQLTLRIKFIKNITQIGLSARVCDLGVRAGAKREEFALERRPAAAVGWGGRTERSVWFGLSPRRLVAPSSLSARAARLRSVVTWTEVAQVEDDRVAARAHTQSGQL